MTNSAPRSIHIVDDDALVLRAVAGVLRARGLTVATSQTAADALREIPVTRPSLVIMDVNLGDRSGIDVALELLRQVDLPIVFLTGGETRFEALTGKEGTFAYLPKPFDRATLDVTIDLVLMQHATRMEARRVERRFHALFEQAAVGVLQVDVKTGRLLAANRKCREILGYSDDELLTLDVLDILHPSSRQDRRRSFDDLASGLRRQLSFDVRACCKDGRDAWLRLDCSAMWDEGEGPSEYVVVVQDITERRRAEVALLDYQRLLDDSQQIAGIGSWGVDLATGQLHWTAEMYRLHGVSPRTFSPTVDSVRALLAGNDRALAGMEQLLADPAQSKSAPPTLYFEVALPDGGRRVLEAKRGVIVRDEADNPVRAIGTVQDVTRRMQVEAAVRESEALYRSLLEAAPEGIFRTRLDGTIVGANPAFGAIVGAAGAEAVLGESLSTFFTDPSALLTMLERGGRINTTWRRAHGPSITVEIVGQHVEYQKDIYLQGFVRDVSQERERSARESQLLEHKEQLELLIEATRLGFWDWQPATQELRFNARMAALLGFTPAEAEPTLAWWQSRIHQDDVASYRRALQAHIDGAVPYYEHVHRMRHRDNRWIYVLDRGRIFERSPRGEPVRFCGTYTDITVEKTAPSGASAIKTRYAP